MKKIYTFLFAVCLTLTTVAQGIRITEISYNGPESGADSTEFVELYNSGTSAVNLQGYSFTQGFVYTFPNVSIGAGAYFVVAVDSVALINTFGISSSICYQWSSGGLSNGGEDIVLVDNNGTTVDSVDYDDGSPWPTTPDGNGPTLVLCDLTLDQNLGSSWSASTSPAGVIVNGNAVFGSPGAADNVCGSSSPAIPEYDLATVTSSDANGSADSLGVQCVVRGVVTTIDFRGGTGLDFSMQDATGAITIFDFNDVSGYSVNMGDSLRVVGTVAQYNGLTQFSPDTIDLVQTTSTPAADTVANFMESQESYLIALNQVYLADPTQWPSSGSSTNMDIVTTNGDTLRMRFDSDADIWDSIPNAPLGYFNVYGSQRQFDNSSPYTSGYQILPRMDTDIDTVNVVQPANPLISFIGNSTSVLETDDSVMIDVVFTNPNAFPVSVDVMYNQSSTAIDGGVDVDFTTVTLTVPASTADTQSVTLYIIDNSVQDGDKDAIIELMNPVNGQIVTGTYTVTIFDDEFVIPTYNIDVLRTVDTDGIPDSLGVYCAIEGIVYGKDLDGNNGISFHVMDETNGINVFNFDDVDNYVVTEGDELRLIGEVDFYNGLTEFVPDSIMILSTGNCIPFPTVVTDLNEDTEANYIEIRGVYLVDPSQWPAPTFNANLDFVTPAGDTLTMRIDKDTYLPDSIAAAPTGTFNIIGIGGQFDTSVPHDEGYQIFPMFVKDFDEEDHSIPAGLVINEVMSNNDGTVMDDAGDYDPWMELYNGTGATIDLVGMYTTNFNLDLGKWRIPRCHNNMSVTLEIADGDWKLLWADFEPEQGPDHLNFDFNIVTPFAIISNFDLTQMVDSIALPNLGADISYGRRTDGALNDWVLFDGSTPDASNNNGLILSVVSMNVTDALKAFPNPANTVVRFNKAISFTAVNTLGQVVADQVNVTELDVTAFDKGLYILRTSENEVVRLIVK